MLSRLGILLSVLLLVVLLGLVARNYHSMQQPASQESTAFLQAKNAIEKNDLHSAKIFLEQCLQHNPEHVLARLYYGQLLREEGEVERAVEIWHSINKGLPSELATARFLEGSVAIDQGYVDRSRDLLVEAVRLKPDYLEAREKLVLVYRMLRRPDELVNQLDAIRRARSLSLQELILRTIPLDAGFPAAETIKILNTTLQRNPQDKDSWIALVRTLREDGEFQQALQFLQSIPGGTEQDSDLLAQYILVLLELDEISKATKICEASDNSKKESIALSEACGRVAFRSGQWATAVKYLHDVYKNNPNHRENCYFLGLALKRLGLTKDAERLVKRSVLLDNIHRLCIRLSQEDISDSRQLLTIYRQLGGELRQLNRFTESATWLLMACKLTPDDTDLISQFQTVRTLAEKHPLDAPFELILPDNLVRSSTEHEKQSESTGISSDSTQPSQIRFEDVHSVVGINFSYFNAETGFEHLIESMGGGVIVIDYDNDGWEDLYFPQGCRLPYVADSNEHTDRLYRNLGGKKFWDVTVEAGLGSNRYGLGGIASDFDNDGDDDLFVSNFGRNTFYRNNGDGTFSDITDEMGMTEQEMSTSVSAADFNLDGLQDLYIVNYVSELKTCPLPDGSYRPCDPASFNGQPDRLWLNDGAGSFIDVSHTAKINLSEGKGLGVVACDFDNDGRSDIYVSNDGVPNFLFHNITQPQDATPVFEEVGLVSGTALDERGQAQAGMGIALADFNMDSLPDLYVTNFYLEHNAYYRNEGDLLFSDDTRGSGLFEPSVPLLGFGTQGQDFDGDGYPDLFIANGHIMHDKSEKQPWKMPAQVFQNQGDGKFVEVSDSAGDYFRQKNLGRGVATLDWNRDGKNDLVVVHQNRPVALLENKSSQTQKTASIKLIGARSNRNGTGATLRYSFHDQTRSVPWTSDGGYLSCNSQYHLINLDKNKTTTEIEIRWPTGKTTFHKISHSTATDDTTTAGDWALTEEGKTIILADKKINTPSSGRP